MPVGKVCSWIANAFAYLFDQGIPIAFEVRKERDRTQLEMQIFSILLWELRT